MLSRRFVFQYPGMVDSVHDGDTVNCHIDFSPMPVHEAHGVAVRLEGINAIELSHQFGGEARDALAHLLPTGELITLVSHKEEKFGRFLARIIRADGTDVNAVMLTLKASDGITPLAVPYLS